MLRCTTTEFGFRKVVAMSSRDRDSGEGAAQEKHIIRERLEQLELVLDLFSQHAADVNLTPTMKRRIAVVVVNNHRVLSNYEGESVIEDGDIPNISPIRQRLGRTTEVETPTKRRGGGVAYEERPAVDELDYWYLEDAARQLEAVSKKLGFWPDATDTVHNDRVSEGDLKALLETRGQTEAVENLPGESGGGEGA